MEGEKCAGLSTESADLALRQRVKGKDIPILLGREVCIAVDQDIINGVETHGLELEHGVQRHPTASLDLQNQKPVMPRIAIGVVWDIQENLRLFDIQCPGEHDYCLRRHSSKVSAGDATRA